MTSHSPRRAPQGSSPRPCPPRASARRLRSPDPGPAGRRLLRDLRPSPPAYLSCPSTALPRPGRPRPPPALPPTCELRKARGQICACARLTCSGPRRAGGAADGGAADGLVPGRRGRGGVRDRVFARRAPAFRTAGAHVWPRELDRCPAADLRPVCVSVGAASLVRLGAEPQRIPMGRALPGLPGTRGQCPGQVTPIDGTPPSARRCVRRVSSRAWRTAPGLRGTGPFKAE